MSRNDRPHFHGHRTRIKQKYRSHGMEAWPDYEVLEFALTFAIPRKDTKPIAKELLRRFKTYNAVLNADADDLRSVKGISDHSALFLRFLKDAAKLYLKKDLLGKDVISSPDAAVRYLTALLKNSPNEEFHALFLDSGNHLLAAENIHTGTVNKSVVYPRNIVERTLRHHAAGVIVAHNHPGGTLRPSEDDLCATAAIKKALEAVEASLLDHIIIGGSEYFSWKEHALL